jgi:NADPH:quinone reductase-like Zn-dependent oxidoreductase
MGRGYVLSVFSRQTIRTFGYTPATKDLVMLKGLVDGGEVTPVVEATYPLAETGAALARVATGHVAGKVVVVP